MLSAVEEIQPKYVFISFADEQEMKKTMNFINLLQEKRESLSVGFIGNLGVLNQLDIETILIGDTKEEWDGWLKCRNSCSKRTIYFLFHIIKIRCIGYVGRV